MRPQNKPRWLPWIGISPSDLYVSLVWYSMVDFGQLKQVASCGDLIGAKTEPACDLRIQGAAVDNRPRTESEAWP